MSLGLRVQLLTSVGASRNLKPYQESSLNVRLAANWVAVVGALVGSGGCSVVVESNRTQCSTNADCTARGAEFAGSVCVDSFCRAPTNWACLDLPPPMAAPQDQFQVSFVVRDTVTQMPKPGLRARLCRKLDVECSNAVSESATVDEQGNVSFQVAAGFDGYARFDGGDLLPGIFFFNPPVSRDTLNIPITLSASTTASALAALTGVALDSGRGVVLLSVLDCTGTPASGITLSSNFADPRARIFYAQEGLPSSMATMTDSSGYGGVVNASPGTVTFSALQAQSGRKIDEVTVLVQAGTQTMTTLVPNGG